MNQSSRIPELSDMNWADYVDALSAMRWDEKRVKPKAQTASAGNAQDLPAEEAPARRPRGHSTPA